MRYTVDRIEGEYAVLCDTAGGSYDVRLNELPEVKEGDILSYDDGVYERLGNETEERRKRLARRTGSMFE